jgi:crotonobetainyl-CoA:carnitine CoA-transferase CaiB-like acyl-CoA transferase
MTEDPTTGEAALPGALDHIRVLDLTTTLSGPWCTHILSTLGADVIKLERRVGGDDSRRAGPPFWNGSAAVFLATNAGKRSLAIDLKSPAGIEIALDLAEHCDVFVQNFRPGAAERLGLGFDALRARNPTIVYCNVGAFGPVGPRSEEPGYDPLAQASTGIMSTTGERGRPHVRTGAPFIDHGAGIWAATGILAALLRRDSVGKAQLVDTSLYEVGVNFQPHLIAGYLASGIVPGPIGRAQTVSVPSEAFFASDGDIVIAAGTNRLFATLCETLGLPALAADPRFATNPTRVVNRDELSAILAERFASEPVAVWIERLGKAGVPAAAVSDIGQVVVDEQFEALGMLQAVPDEGNPDLRLVAPPLSIDGERLPLRFRPPSLGEHTREILSEIAYDDARIDELYAGEIVGGEPSGEGSA